MTSQDPDALSSSSLPPELIDVDCNLWHSDLQTLQPRKIQDPNSSEQLLDDCWNILQEDAVQKANIVAMLSPSSTIREARQGLDRFRKSQPSIPIRTTVGVHPYHVLDAEFDNLPLEHHKAAIQQLLQDHPDHCAAVGECGLDASDGFPPLAEQLPWFQMQIEIANSLGLPLFVHERLAFQESMELLAHAQVPVIIHCFTGTRDQCQAYIERGYFISISGYILKENTADNKVEDGDTSGSEVALCLQQGMIPLEKLMIETDAPYMGFPNCRKLYLETNSEYVAGLNAKKRKRLQQSIYPNVPSSLPQVLQRVTECLQCHHGPSLTMDHVAKATTQNARTFFGF
eukprot:CAMPEP_0178751906 /NCGR_PEP_ID=MMETSP0744-20121128/10774_1 /TAXON_ID=913974 /ORGANISM="Nitzschia punctata, Strain CCMP561" /LENGTH=342 /DNA_ID=CAMNT_0020405579 /DNA_START=1388 /DNA_END=2416 /DNA_ORIENTATION=+